MWILKGALLGLLLLGFETVAFIYFTVYRNLPPPPSTGVQSVDVRVFAIPTIENPWWWATLIITFALACWFFKTRAV